MKTTVTSGKDMVVTPGIQKRIDRKTASMSRYLRQDTEMFVRLRKERSQRICEITVPMGGGVTLRAESSSDDNLFMAIDQALAKLEKQILRHRTKLEKRLREDADMSETEFVEDIYPETEKAVVRRKNYPMRPMSEEDAALQMVPGDQVEKIIESPYKSMTEGSQRKIMIGQVRDTKERKEEDQHHHNAA